VLDPRPFRSCRLRRHNPNLDRALARLRRCQFYARARDRDEAFGLSESFRTWCLPWEARVPIEDDPRALSALEALEAKLLARGWERMRRAPGAEWYELRFRRPAAEPVSSSRPRVRLNPVSSTPEAATS
jgi:hypothetical protein